MTDTALYYRTLGKFLNVLFIIYLILFGVFGYLYFAKPDFEYLQIGQVVLNIYAYGLFFICLFVLVYSFHVAHTQKKFPFSKFFLTLFEMIISYVSMFAVNSLTRIVSEGLYLKI